MSSEKNLEHQINIKFCVNIDKSATETLVLCCEEVRRLWVAEIVLGPVGNVDKVKTLVQSDQRLSVRRIEYE